MASGMGEWMPSFIRAHDVCWAGAASEPGVVHGWAVCDFYEVYFGYRAADDTRRWYMQELSVS